MENYKDKFLLIVQESIATQQELFEDDGKNFEESPVSKALDLAKQILSTRFANELRQYNNNEEKAYDEFIARKNLEYLSIFIEESLLLDKPTTDLPFYRAVQKEMRGILHVLYHSFKE